jgi:hypothetical protein
MKWLCPSMKSCPDIWLVTLRKIIKTSAVLGYEPCASRLQDSSVRFVSKYSTAPARAMLCETQCFLLPTKSYELQLTQFF